MNIQENISLLPFNTFGIDKNARFFAIATSTEDVKQLIQKSKEMNVPLFILGGGSNILLTKNLEALVMKIEIKGFELIEKYMKRDYKIPTSDEDYVYVSQLLQAKGIVMGIEAQRRAKLGSQRPC